LAAKRRSYLASHFTNPRSDARTKPTAFISILLERALAHSDSNNHHKTKPDAAERREALHGEERLTATR
jgi:hypothetical protein